MPTYVKKGEWLDLRLPAKTGLDDAQADAYLINELRMPLSLLKKLKRHDGIQLKNDRILIRLFPGETAQFPAEWADLDILYEDDFCLVINKASGMAVHPAQPGQGGTLANAVAGYYERTGQSAAIRHIHRLDEHTSGPVLYAKNEYSHWLLDDAMRRKAISRTYIAVVAGIMKQPSGRIAWPIGRDRHHSQRRRVSATGQHAVTNYEVLETLSAASLVKLELETGRTHQIRVHLSHLGHPIIGDKLYGGPMMSMTRQALHGTELGFPHPLTDEKIAVTAPLPDDMVALLAQL
jgi:23S rRNA pseudouridine1911/1915/1917 synthase